MAQVPSERLTELVPLLLEYVYVEQRHFLRLKVLSFW